MTPRAADRHRAHHSKPGRPWPVAVAICLALTIGGSGCGPSSLPRPPLTQVRTEDYVAVPFAPRPPAVEIIPTLPRTGAVWVDGTWAFNGTRYTWQPGAWVLPPPGAKHARWVLVRRPVDGQLFFAPSSWRAADGSPIPEPEALVRARSRPESED